MPSLNLNGNEISIKELKEISIGSNLGAFEKSTLSFCKAWLNNQNEFRINTSGSTGTPKEVVLKREAMEASARMTIKALQLKPNGTALVCLDTKYIAGQMMIVRSLLSDMKMIAVEPSSNPLLSIDQPIEFAALVPYQLEAILDQSPQKLNQIQCAIIGGAAVSNSLQKKTQKTLCDLYATYGMTETISHVALRRLNGSNKQDYFEALSNIHLRLDERGCLCIRANHLDDEIITNDVVELIGENKFHWLGRIDNVINSGGVKIIPEKIEAVFEKIFDENKIKNRFFIVGIPDEKLGERLSLIIEGNSLEKSLQEKILSEAGKNLSKYEVPKELTFINKFKETKTGKIIRSRF
jgi:O-succinylbenzoic acid--CoA ligase